MSANASNVVQFTPPLIQCTACERSFPSAGFYQRKERGYMQPCRSCWQKRAQSRDDKAAAQDVGKRAIPGTCTCECMHGVHRSNGKGPCSKCGPLKCPSYFEKGL